MQQLQRARAGLAALILGLGLAGAVQAGGIEGVVMNAAGQMLEGAVIEAFAVEDSTQTFTARTDEAGFFQLDGLPAGLFVVYASAEGYRTQRLDIDVPDAAAVVALDFVLEPVDTTPVYDNLVSGTVRDADTEAPIPQIDVYLEGQTREIYYRTVTDDAGRFRFEDLVPQAYTLATRSTQYGWVTQDDPVVVEPEAQVTGLEIDLTALFEAFATLTGTVRAAEDGAPVHPAVVRLRSAEMDAAGDTVRYDAYRALTEPDGTYRIEEIVPGSYEATIYSERYRLPDAVSIDLADGEAATLDVEVDAIPFETVSGRVTFDGTGSPAPGVEVSFMAQNGGRGQRTVTDGDGRYTAEVPPGTYLAMVHVANEDSASFYWEYYDNALDIEAATAITVIDGEPVTGIDFGIPDLAQPVEATISGTVTDVQGTPMAGVAVMAHDFYGSEAVFETRTAADGTYTLTLDRYVYGVMIWAYKAGYAMHYYPDDQVDYHAEPLVIDWSGAGTTGIDFVLKPIPEVEEPEPGMIQGQVIRQAGQPISGATVTAYSLDDPRRTAFARTDSTGIYLLEDLGGGGEFIVLFTAPGYVPQYVGETQTWQASPPVPEQAADVSAQLAPLPEPAGTLELTGQALLPDGAPATGALLFVHDAAGQTVAYDLADATGTYYIDGLAPGTYTVHVDNVGYEPMTMTLDLDESAEGRALMNATLTPVTSTTIDDDPETPAGFRLAQNYPNPFNPATTIRYTLDRTTRVTLRVVDLLGREVARLVDGVQPGGEQTVTFRAPASWPSGLYVYQLDAGTQVEARTMLLLK